MYQQLLLSQDETLPLRLEDSDARAFAWASSAMHQSFDFGVHTAPSGHSPHLSALPQQAGSVDLSRYRGQASGASIHNDSPLPELSSWDFASDMAVSEPFQLTTGYPTSSVSASFDMFYHSPSSTYPELTSDMQDSWVVHGLDCGLNLEFDFSSYEPWQALFDFSNFNQTYPPPDLS
jgi:hypothetical protein